MKIFVKAKAKTRMPKVTQVDDTHFFVSVREPAHDGKANAAIIKSLAVYLHIPKSSITLVSGETYKEKVFEIVE